MNGLPTGQSCLLANMPSLAAGRCHHGHSLTDTQPPPPSQARTHCPQPEASPAFGLLATKLAHSLNHPPFLHEPSLNNTQPRRPHTALMAALNHTSQSPYASSTLSPYRPALQALQHITQPLAAASPIRRCVSGTCLMPLLHPQSNSVLGTLY